MPTGKRRNNENICTPTANTNDISISAKLAEIVGLNDGGKGKNDGIDSTKLCLAKAALHTSTPARLPSREAEIDQIQFWIQQHLVHQYSGGMYISGSPGTGKTAVVDYVLNNTSSMKDRFQFKVVKINCMSIKNQPQLIFEEMAKQLSLQAKTEDKVLARLVSKRCQMIVMVLDEVDQLTTSNLGSSKAVLKNVFDWPKLMGSRLILIGIANALDLSTRYLPKYFTTSNFEQNNSPKPKKNGKIPKPDNPADEGGFLMHFTPYKKEEITLILEDRLNGNNVFDASAIKFVATKVAATSGDIRKALNACKQALETVEKQEVRKVLKVTADDGFNPGASPKKQRTAANGGPIGVLALSKVMAAQRDEGPIPLQQGVILLTLHRLNSAAPNSKNQEDGIQAPVPIDRVYIEHLKICEKYMFPRIDRSDLPSALSMLQDRSLVTIIGRSQSNSPSSSSPRTKTGSLKRGFCSKNQSSGMTGLLFDPRTIELTLRNDSALSQKLQ